MERRCYFAVIADMKTENRAGSSPFWNIHMTEISVSPTDRGHGGQSNPSSAQINRDKSERGKNQRSAVCTRSNRMKYPVIIRTKSERGGNQRSTAHTQS